MGRGTYESLAYESTLWAYSEQRVLVVTSRPIDDPKGSLETRQEVDELLAELRALDDGGLRSMFSPSCWAAVNHSFRLPDCGPHPG